MGDIERLKELIERIQFEAYKDGYKEGFKDAVKYCKEETNERETAIHTDC